MNYYFSAKVPRIDPQVPVLQIIFLLHCEYISWYKSLFFTLSIYYSLPFSLSHSLKFLSLFLIFPRFSSHSLSSLRIFRITAFHSDIPTWSSFFYTSLYQTLPSGYHISNFLFIIINSPKVKNLYLLLSFSIHTAIVIEGI